MRVYDIDSHETKITDLITLFGDTKIKKAISVINKHKKTLGEAEYVYSFGEGDCCMDCGSVRLVKTGTCHACLDCGSSQGCS